MGIHDVPHHNSTVRQMFVQYYSKQQLTHWTNNANNVINIGQTMGNEKHGEGGGA
jgi:hypothetical protein